MIQIRRQRPFPHDDDDGDKAGKQGPHEGSAGPVSNFARGELVRHRRYAYRGVIVDLDLRCAAPDAWYLANRTQPDREQPWYHVLVDGATHTTYVAEENLVLDDDLTGIWHPLLTEYFSDFVDGSYVRNERPWAG